MTPDKRIEEIAGRILTTVGSSPALKDEEWKAKAKNWIQDLLLSYRQEVVDGIREKVIRRKEATRAQTGAFKYDDCYDEVLDILASLTPNEKE